ncbi:hypothetical protein I546_5451 [Mycobacterium kansasii 732]|nr:hypothetical protein I546_5451 [Mycobacterium kansasii 732]
MSANVENRLRMLKRQALSMYVDERLAEPRYCGALACEEKAFIFVEAVAAPSC